MTVASWDLVHRLSARLRKPLSCLVIRRRIHVVHPWSGDERQRARPKIGSDLDTTNQRLTISYQMFGTTLATIDLDPRFITTDPSPSSRSVTRLSTRAASDVAVTPMGYWVTAYYHADNAADLRAAGRLGAWSSSQYSMEWRPSRGHLRSNWNLRVDLDTDSGDNTFIAFHSGDQLKVATFESGQWVATSVDGNVHERWVGHFDVHRHKQ